MYNVKENEVSETNDKFDNSVNPYKQYTYSQYETEEDGAECVEGNDGYTFKIVSNYVGNKYYCVYNKDGKEMFEPKKLDSDNISCICLDKDGFVLDLGSVYPMNEKYEYYDLQGNLLTKYKDIEKMKPFHEGLAYATKSVMPNGSYFYIDKNGKKVIE